METFFITLPGAQPRDVGRVFELHLGPGNSRTVVIMVVKGEEVVYRIATQFEIDRAMIDPLRKSA